MAFKFSIHQFVALQAHVELYDLCDVQPLTVSERLFQECEGGAQLFYLVRAIEVPGHESAAFRGNSSDGYFKVKEGELVALDVASYRAAMAETPRGQLRQRLKDAKTNNT